MFGKRPTSTARMSRLTAGSLVRSELGLDRERNLIAWGELVHEALALDVQEGGALAAHRLRHEEAVARAVEPEGRGVELHELEVGERGAGGAREREAGLTAPRGLVVRCQSAAMPPVARITAPAGSARARRRAPARLAPRSGRPGSRARSRRVAPAPECARGWPRSRTGRA